MPWLASQMPYSADLAAAEAQGHGVAGDAAVRVGVAALDVGAWSAASARRSVSSFRPVPKTSFSMITTPFSVAATIAASSVTASARSTGTNW